MHVYTDLAVAERLHKSLSLDESSDGSLVKVYYQKQDPIGRQIAENSMQLAIHSLLYAPSSLLYTQLLIFYCLLVINIVLVQINSKL